MPHLPPLALIAGPTASGKSALALDLAERANGTIINADASQVYRDLRILTARPSAQEEARVPHALFGHVDGADSYSAARWADDAKQAIAAANIAGRLPIVVGGSGLYLRTLMEGIAPVPAIETALRGNIRALPVAAAYAALQAEDPPAAARLAPTDTQRIARALEVIRATGRPIAWWQSRREGGIAGQVRLTAARLLPDRAWLATRIDARAARMLAGARDEVAALLARALPPNAPILRAIGVPELAALLRGEITETEALARLQLATRRYAKRQYTWFRHQPPDEWCEYNDLSGIVDVMYQQISCQGKDTI